MVQLTDKEFDEIVTQAINGLPEVHRENLRNIAFVVEKEPTIAQRQAFNLTPDQTLFGLFEGTPLTKRNGIFSLEMPDKITIFKNPIAAYASTPIELTQIVKNTVWHEVAHFFGLGHSAIYSIERRHGHPHSP